MIVFDLKCSQDHRFEGWFRATSDFLHQQDNGLLTCPQCGCADVGKAPMAPAVATAGVKEVAPAEQSTDKGDTVLTNQKLPAELAKALTKLAALQVEALKTSTWVGDAFAEKSRAMHYGEQEVEPIHGRAKQEEAEALLEEGVMVAPILIPFAPPEEVN